MLLLVAQTTHQSTHTYCLIRFFLKEPEPEELPSPRSADAYYNAQSNPHKPQNKLF